MSKPVFYNQASPGIPISTTLQLQTAGAIITILDYALVNGGNLLNVQSIERSGTTAILTTDSPHIYREDDVVHIENTLDANFNNKFIVKSVSASNEIVITVEDVGATSLGAVGTVKNAAAGWNKVISGTNIAVYETGLFYDGTRRYVQIEDNSPYGQTIFFRVRVAKNLTALNTAEVITMPYRYSKLSNHGIWLIVADDKTMYISFNNTTLYCIGYVKELSELDIVPFYVTAGTEGGSHADSFGYSGSTTVNWGMTTAAGAMLESTRQLMPHVFATTSVLGVVGPNTSLSTLQAQNYPYNSFTGEYLLAEVDIWEKNTDTSPYQILRAKARGFYQPHGRLNTDYFDTSANGNSPGFIKIKANNLAGKERKLIITTIKSYSGPQVAIDITGDW